MNDEFLRSKIQERFKRVDNELSKFNKISKCWMGCCSVFALLNAVNIVDNGLNVSNGLFITAFTSLAVTAHMAQKTITMGRQNLELRNVLNEQDRQLPQTIYTNDDTGRKVLKIMEWTIGLGAISWLLGKLPTPNFNFLMGAVSCSCMAYEYHLTKKNRKVLSAEFPKGVIDEHTR